MLKSMLTEMPHSGTNSEGEVHMRRTMSELESVPSHFTRATGNCKNDPCIKILSNTSVAELPCPFWRVD